MRFLHIAMGSACEMEYQLLLACELSLLGRPAYERLAADTIAVKRMLAALIGSLRHAPSHTPARPGRTAEGSTDA